MPSLTLQSVFLTKPDGTALTPEFSLTFGTECSGITGPNGCGKSTLLRLLSGESPVSGAVIRRARTGTLLQNWDDLSLSVGAALGQEAPLARLARISAGIPMAEDIDRADWELEARIIEAMARAGLAIDLSRPLASLSGGQRTRVGLARLFLEAPEILLLDEPTNNLDTEGRALVAQLVRDWPGGVVLVSHDRNLLQQMDRIIELSPTGVHVTSGGFSAYTEARAARRTRAATILEHSKQREARIRQEIQAQREKKERRDKAGRALRSSGSQPKVLLDARTDRAGRTLKADKHRAARLMQAAENARIESAALISNEKPLHIVAEASHSGTKVLSVDHLVIRRGGFGLGPLSFTLNATERVALIGPNGAGKSTLLNAIRGRLTPHSGQITCTSAHAALDQNVADLNLAHSLLNNLRQLHPELTSQAAHALLARYGFRNTTADTPVRALSGGERLRAGLAAALGGTPPALLILDEPTNHLDLDTIELLENALHDYNGALLIASHDSAFLDAISITRKITLL